MSRDTKFKVWHIKRKVMLVVYNLAFSDEFNEPLAYDSVQVRLDGSWEWLEEDEFILIQFTGLLDKNFDNGEIYKGDLLGFWFGKYNDKQLIQGEGLDSNSIVEVKMVDGCWMAGDKLLIKALEYKHKCGTIHENPELLK